MVIGGVSSLLTAKACVHQQGDEKRDDDVLLLAVRTGHRDIVADGRHCLPLNRQRDIGAIAANPLYDGWGESSIDEIVEKLLAITPNKEDALTSDSRFQAIFAS